MDGAEARYGAFASRPGVRVKGKGFLGLVVVSAALAGSWWLVRGSAVGELTVFFLGMLLVPAAGVLAVLDFWRWRRRREGIALALALGAVVLWGCVLRERWGFSLEAGRPFVVELGRGSGWHGLNIVIVQETGAVAMYRMNRQARVEQASLQLTREQVQAVAGLVNRERLTGLTRAYENRDIRDGSQWVMWIEQGEKQRAVYYNNAFPGAIVRFAEGLDGVLDAAGQEGVVWRELGKAEGRAVERGPWLRVGG